MTSKRLKKLGSFKISIHKRKTPRQYNREFKIKDVKLCDEIGKAKASSELGIPEGTLYGWIKDPIYNTVLEKRIKNCRKYFNPSKRKQTVKS